MLKKVLLAAASFCLLCSAAMAAVEINTADQAALDSVIGIGPATSRAILEERKKGGNFKDWADLEARVKGVGEKNSVKLSTGGLVINGQSHQPATATSKPAKPAKTNATPVKAAETRSQ